MIPKIGDPVTEFRDPCGCVWKDGKRVSVCPKHRHKDGIKPEHPVPKFKYMR